MGKLALPDRWDQYESLGRRIPGTRFITFKVPLSKEISEYNSLDPKDKFTPHKLQELLTEQGLNLGLVIDLTFTDRYYHPKEFHCNNIRHTKIKTRGHAVPNRRVCKRFLNVVDKFLEENKENDHLIGIHCTHGVNRTGYLVCRYMIDKLDFGPEEAIQACGTARGYNIERENYLESLKEGKTTYDDVQDDEDFDSGNWQRQNGGVHNPRGHFTGQRDQYHGQYDRQSNNTGYGSGRGHPNSFNSYNPRPRGGYGNGYNNQPRTFNDYAPRRFGYQHGNNNGYNSPNTASHQGSFTPRTFGYQHGAGQRNYDTNHMHGPRANSYNKSDGNYNSRSEPYQRQSRWNQERPHSSRQNSYSRRSKDFNPYAQYS